jgi:hypothetical protein
VFLTSTELLLSHLTLKEGILLLYRSELHCEYLWIMVYTTEIYFKKLLFWLKCYSHGHSWDLRDYSLLRYDAM